MAKSRPGAEKWRTNHRRAPRRANLAISAALIIAVGLYLLVVGDTASHRSTLFATHGKPLIVKAGGSLKVDLGQAAEGLGPVVLRFRCGAGGGCEGLRIAGDQTPRAADSHRTEFIVMGPEADKSIVLANPSEAPVVISEYRVEDTLALNTGIPRFTVFVGSRATGSLGGLGPWILMLCGVVLLAVTMVAGGRRSTRGFMGPGSLAVLAVPLVVLALSGILRWLGCTLVIGWDAFLLLCGGGLAIMALAGVLRGVVGLFSSSGGKKTSGAAAAALPGLVLFFFLPANIYTHNQGDLDYNLAMLLPFAAALALYLLLLGVAALAKQRRAAIFKGLFFLGLFLLIRDMATPLDVGELAGSLAIRDVSEPTTYIIIDIALALAALAGAFFTPWSAIKGFASILVVVLTLFHAVSLGLALEDRTHVTLSSSPPQHPVPPPAKAAQSGNIYHLILDGFSNQVAPAILSDPVLAKAFEGFTFFSRARSNYLYTGLSIPSFMTGSLAPYRQPGQSEAQWHKAVQAWAQSATREGIIKAAHAAGYNVTQYMNTRLFFPHQKASTIYYGAQLFGQAAIVQAMVRFGDLWLLRAAPTILKQETWTEENRGLLAGLMREPGDHAWAYWAQRQIAKLTRAESARPPKGSYVYGHFLMPHRPLVVDANCNYRPAGKTPAAYRDQATCALRKVAAFLAELKRLGRFDDALIVLQSDHGSRLGEMRDTRDRLPPWLIDEINKIRPGKRAGNTNQNLNMALIMIKPPGATLGPLVKADKIVSLVDIAATIYRLKGWPLKPPQGRDLFAPGSDAKVDVFIHLPLKRIYRTEREYWHLIFDGAKWRMDENYPQAPAKQ